MYNYEAREVRWAESLAPVELFAWVRVMQNTVRIAVPLHHVSRETLCKVPNTGCTMAERAEWRARRKVAMRLRAWRGRR